MGNGVSNTHTYILRKSQVLVYKSSVSLAIPKLLSLFLTHFPLLFSDPAIRNSLSSQNTFPSQNSKPLHMLFSLPGMFFFFLNYFIEIWLTCKKLYIFNIYNLMSLKISIHLWNHHNQCYKNVHHLQKFPPTFIIITIYCYYFMIRTLKSYVHLNRCRKIMSKFSVYLW